MLRILLTIVFVIACVAMTVIVLMQEGKSSGLGALSGAAESHWAKNKGRTLEGNNLCTGTCFKFKHLR